MAKSQGAEGDGAYQLSSGSDKSHFYAACPFFDHLMDASWGCSFIDFILTMQTTLYQNISSTTSSKLPINPGDALPLELTDLRSDPPFEVGERAVDGRTEGRKGVACVHGGRTQHHQRRSPIHSPSQVPKALITQERPTYYWLYTNINSMYRWVSPLLSCPGGREGRRDGL